ncbi:MAG: sulfurtransferase [Candidatus Dactylopiibacterium carminicum]|uniref:Sulfurtransferase n=1 Tax=Candidatus Dactylopiibacterium carminicum TaxID=857335 RepID=A0A272EN50_9RHOO|nr:rhodanese-like domain-containing protein [Candidatus Dactylopiibacterium carminicum]KAF7597945.1 sulfurtransferase [Candidatus Dactylopiibacterium carminicum]PAS91519.1 MAG: sulfurtransferase [Candidatus Dactylopiibacterium carminicum]PAS93066.1 MAG: sulfurtransferase [Candidatus Dactylopiibacterium carminicum]PAS96069.1 MAG: sulfurtransferase [Candidatus Dactylopiibacterium carminicum]
MQSLSVEEFAAWLADPARVAPMLLDVREPWEFELVSMPDAVPMPMGTVPTRFQELAPEREIVCVCHHGMRSAQVAEFLARQGCEKVYNLAGGIDAWARQIDPAMPVY